MAADRGHVDDRNPVERPSAITQPPATRTAVATPEFAAPLNRQQSTHSIHAHNALRRMATHETGELTVTADRDRQNAESGLDTHDEHDHEHEQGDGDDHRDEDRHQTTSDSHEEATVEGEEKRGKKKEFVLQDQTNLLPVKQVIAVFVGLTCALFCSLLDQTIVTTALPTLGRVFNRADIAPWVGTAYLLTATAMQPIYGRLSDIFGRKFVLLGALVIFFIGSLACAVAQSMIQLITFRAIQGLGGGGILTLSMIIISDVVSLKERGKYQGIAGTTVALANSLGPVLGGIFSEKASWRWCFFLSLPLTAIATLVIIFVLPLRRVKGSMVEKLKKLDWYGSVLTLAWAVLVLLGLSWAGSQYPWGSAAVIAPIVIGLVLLGVFLVVEWKVVPLPLVPLHIFKDGTVSSVMASTFLSGMVFYSTLYYLPTYFQVARGVSAIRSGVLLLPLILVQTVTSFATGILQSRTGDYWWNMTIGFTMWTVGIGLLSSIKPDTPLGHLVGFQIIAGVGAGQTFQTGLIAVQAAVERKDMAVATGIRNFVRQLGGTIALTICSTIVNNLVEAKLDASGLTEADVRNILKDPTTLESLGFDANQRAIVANAYAHGINACFWFMIPCAGISLFLTIFYTKRVSLKRDDDAQKKAEAKAWIESKKAKKMNAKHPGDRDGEAVAARSRQESATSTVAADSESGPVSKLEKGLEHAGRDIEETAGGVPSQKEAREEVILTENR